MRCVSCGARKKGAPEGFSLRCPNCGHPVAATRGADRISDPAINAALDRVTGHGQLYFVPDHLGYEILRRGFERRRRFRKWAWAGAALTGLALVVPGIGGWRWALAAAGAVMLAVWAMRNLHVPKRPFRVARRYLEVNPSERVAPAAGRPEAEPGPATREVTDIADRVLVCQHTRYADFLLANDFHLHHACPVLGPGEYPQNLFPNLLARLKALGKPSVYVIHDLTPSGLDFVRVVREDRSWFGDCPDAVIFNLGLVSQHAGIGPERALSEIRGAGRGSLAAKVSRGAGIELTALRPGTLMRSLGQALVTGLPLALVAAAGERSGQRDSE